MNKNLNKKSAALVSVVSNTSRILVKMIAGIASGSISIISEAVHSMSDLLAAVLAFFSVSKSSEPADEQHQFGHGKYEDLSGLIEGILILLAAFYILNESLRKIIQNVHVVENTNLGIIVMLFAVVVNTMVSLYLYKVAKATDSIALLADAEHLKTDVYSSFAVFAGLVAIKITGISVLDPIIAIVVAVMILGAGYKICKKAANNLLDGTLPKEENAIIYESLEKYKKNNKVEFKNIKTRKSGNIRQIELTMLVEPQTSIKEGHILCDNIESEIEKKIGNASFIIHLEPLD